MMENYIVISNCVVYNVAYDVSLDQEEVKENSNQDLLGLCKWFYENCMVQNPVKFHYICLGKDVVSNSWQCYKEDLKATIHLGNWFRNRNLQQTKVWRSYKNLCSKAFQNLEPLRRISNLLDIQKNNLLFNTKINCQFRYRAPVCMFCSRRSNSLVKFALTGILSRIWT